MQTRKLFTLEDVGMNIYVIFSVINAFRSFDFFSNIRNQCYSNRVILQLEIDNTIRDT